MAARAMWKGTVTFGTVELPVKLYAAAQDRGVPLRLVHAKDLAPVRQRMVHPRTGREVSREEIRRGYEVEPGVFVVLEDEELASLEPEPSREIRILRFVPDRTIPPPWYLRPYWLGPDGEGAGEDYFALAEALRREGRAGIARWVMRKGTYHGALRAEGGRLQLLALRRASEVVSAKDLPAPVGRDLEPRERALARQLVAALEAEFDLAVFRDEYRVRLEELVRAKAEGGKPKLRKLKRRKEAPSLAQALEASVKRARQAS